MLQIGDQIPHVLQSDREPDQTGRNAQQILLILRQTLMRRPELLDTAELDNEEREMLRALLEERGAEHGRD